MVGKTISHYRILEKLGEGGMGEVYLAQDTKLKRQVALKVLPESLRHDPQRLRRFQTEAEAAAKLNHPNIAHVYTVEEDQGTRLITMEYVEGQPLKELIPEDGLDLDTFFAWFIPLADALTQAHEKGVRHRDIKPGNIMMTPQRVPKILDFGLAQIISPEVKEDSATWRQTLTEPGAILGTAAYMSPEQAEGKAADHRSDIFSFGVVMYEALTGQRPFKGETYASTVGSILKEEPEPIKVLKPEMPYLLGHAVNKCLRKNLRRRYQSMLEVRNDLEAVKAEVDAGVIVGLGTEAAGASALVSRWRWPVWVGTAVLLATIVAWATWILGRMSARPELPLLKFQLALVDQATDIAAISPDGMMVAYRDRGRLWIRDLDKVKPREIPVTDGVYNLFWSPTSDFIGYAVGNTLWKVSAQGGPSTQLCELPGLLGGATWGQEGTIVLAASSGELFAVSAQGGEPQLLMKPDSSKGNLAFHTPHLLPDGQSLLFSIVKDDNAWEIVTRSGETTKRLIHHVGERIGWPTYSSTGHILYQRGWPISHGVWAVPFSLSTLRVTGDPFVVAPDGAFPSVSSSGTLLYESPSTTGGSQQLVWADRSGRVEGSIGQSHEQILGLALSPGYRRVAVSGVENGNADIWIHDITRSTKTRLTFDPAVDYQPVWSPSADQIVFSSLRSGSGDIFIKAADGSGAVQPLVRGPLVEGASQWSQDGRYLVYHVIDPIHRDLWYVPLTGDRQAVALLQTPFDELLAQISPDGRYVAYQSNESGRWEVYVKPFPRGEGKWQVSVNSANGGVHPKWDPRGNELFYVDGNNLMAVPVQTRPGFRMDIPYQLFTGEQVGTSLSSDPFNPIYDVAPDGERFVVVQNVAEGTTTITIVQSWFVAFE
ncbi:protein kinase [Acidobacteria bacterium AH-259-G07]|nr:protein kinase [Acidobacteria bacterium AH-259-G07]